MTQRRTSLCLVAGHVRVFLAMTALATAHTVSQVYDEEIVHQAEEED